MAGLPICVDFYKNDGSQKVVSFSPQNQATIIIPDIDNIVIQEGNSYDWTREGYDFLKWNSYPDGSGQSYFPGDELTVHNTEEVPDNAYFFYAIWKEQRKFISKIQLPNDSIRYLSVDWEDIFNKPDLTREQVIEIIEDLYPNATSAEVEEMADEILQDYATVTEDMVEEILESSPGGSLSYAPINSPSFTGVPTAPTASRGTNTTQIATTAFVQEAIANIGNVQGVLYGN